MAKKQQPEQAAPQNGAMIRVTSQVEGFRRAGRAWSKQPTVVEAGEFTAEQLVALADEPMLSIEEVARGE